MMTWFIQPGGSSWRRPRGRGISAGPDVGGDPCTHLFSELGGRLCLTLKAARVLGGGLVWSRLPGNACSGLCSSFLLHWALEDMEWLCHSSLCPQHLARSWHRTCTQRMEWMEKLTSMWTVVAVDTGLRHLILAGGSLTVIGKAQCWGSTAHTKISTF